MEIINIDIDGEEDDDEDDEMQNQGTILIKTNFYSAELSFKRNLSGPNF